MIEIVATVSHGCQPNVNYVISPWYEANEPWESIRNALVAHRRAQSNCVYDSHLPEGTRILVNCWPVPLSKLYPSQPRLRRLLARAQLPALFANSHELLDGSSSVCIGQSVGHSHILEWANHYLWTLCRQCSAAQILIWPVGKTNRWVGGLIRPSRMEMENLTCLRDWVWTFHSCWPYWYSRYCLIVAPQLIHKLWSLRHFLLRMHRGWRNVDAYYYHSTSPFGPSLHQ